jgi:hypothetical protein
MFRINSDPNSIATSAVPHQDLSAHRQLLAVGELDTGVFIRFAPSFEAFRILLPTGNVSRVQPRRSSTLGGRLLPSTVRLCRRRCHIEVNQGEVDHLSADNFPRGVTLF